MVCGGNFTLSICKLTIKEVEGLKHEGNWTCQLKLNSNWINSTNYVVVEDVTNDSDRISIYMGRFIEQITTSMNTFFSMMNEFDIPLPF